LFVIRAATPIPTGRTFVHHNTPDPGHTCFQSLAISSRFDGYEQLACAVGNFRRRCVRRNVPGTDSAGCNARPAQTADRRCGLQCTPSTEDAGCNARPAQQRLMDTTYKVEKDRFPNGVEPEGALAMNSPSLRRLAGCRRCSVGPQPCRWKPNRFEADLPDFTIATLQNVFGMHEKLVSRFAKDNLLRLVVAWCCYLAFLSFSIWHCRSAAPLPHTVS
jgi:hypothetical protein